MNPTRSTMNPAVTLICAVAGGCVGALIQLWRSRTGLATLATPYSLPVTMVVLAAVLIILGVRIRRALSSEKKKPINPFTAVRLLAAARAGQCVGGVFCGISLGLFIVLLFRSVMPPLPLWLPTLISAAAALVLIICAAITERLCKIPPTDSDDDDGNGGFSRSQRPSTNLSHHAHPQNRSIRNR
jgi:hypothetical protein